MVSQQLCLVRQSPHVLAVVEDQVPFNSLQALTFPCIAHADASKTVASQVDALASHAAPLRQPQDSPSLSHPNSAEDASRMALHGLPSGALANGHSSLHVHDKQANINSDGPSLFSDSGMITTPNCGQFSLCFMLQCLPVLFPPQGDNQDLAHMRDRQQHNHAFSLACV